MTQSVPPPPRGLAVPESHTASLWRRLWCGLVGHAMHPPKRFGAPRVVYRCRRCGHEAGFTVERLGVGDWPRDPSKPEKRG